MTVSFGNGRASWEWARRVWEQEGMRGRRRRRCWNKNRQANDTYSENSPHIQAAAYRTSQIPLRWELLASK